MPSPSVSRHRLHMRMVWLLRRLGGFQQLGHALGDGPQQFRSGFPDGIGGRCCPGNTWATALLCPQQPNVGNGVPNFAALTATCLNPAFLILGVAVLGMEECWWEYGSRSLDPLCLAHNSHGPKT